MAPLAECDKLEIVTEEVEICKRLTSNDLKVRKRGLSSLKKWFKAIGSKKGLQEDDFNRIWSGLFYYFWMSDKLLVQEDAADFISGLLHDLDNYQAAILYTRGFFSSIVKQWDRISHYRIDKFLMFVRRFLRQILILLKNHEWDIEKLEMFGTELYNAMQVLPYSLALHLNEIFNEEVAKISKGQIPTDALVTLFKGFFECIVNLRPSMQVVNSIQTNIFGGLARQLKLYIKQKALTDDCDNEKNDENAGSNGQEVNTSALDPRPGGVDVFLPFIEFDEKIFVKFMEEYTSKQIPTKARNILTQLISMFASITKLRTTVSDTDKLIREMQDNPKKRKRPKQTLSKLIKKSCRKLEEEDDESEAEHDERILKKLRNLTDLIQIPAGKSTFTVVQAKTKNTEPKRTSISNEWTVTETVDEPSTPKKAKISGSKSDWVVEETTPKENEKSTNKTDKKSPTSFSVQETTPKDNEKSTNKTDKKSPASFSVQETTPKSSENLSNNEIDKKSPASLSVQDITPKSGEKSITKTDKKSPDLDSVQKTTPKGAEKTSIISPKKSPRLVSEELSLTCNDNISDHENEIVNEPTDKVDDEGIDELDINLEIANSPISLSDQSAVIPADKSNDENERSPVSAPMNTEGIEFIEISEDLTAPKVEDIKKSNSPSPKKLLSVSFTEKPAISYYEEDGKKEGQNCDTESEVVVPASVVKERPKLMKENKNYVVVDFQSKPEEDEELTQEPEKVSNEPPTESETITRVLRSRKVESTPVPSTPDSKRTRKPREKKSESSSQSQSQRKSTRIAEKQKRVLFKLEENTYQDIPTYEKVLKSKPASPFDSSKLPASGILKPYAVTSPINPFYFANGKRKLNRKRRKN